MNFKNRADIGFNWVSVYTRLSRSYSGLRRQEL